jgi:hypothetical protein
MNGAVAAHISGLSTSEMRAGDPHMEGCAGTGQTVGRSCDPARIPAGWPAAQERPTLRHGWPTLARAAALGRVGQGAQTLAHNAKKPATAVAGRAEGGVCAYLLIR